MNRLESLMLLAAVLFVAGCCGARSIDKIGGVRLVYELQDENTFVGETPDDDALAQMQEIIPRRLAGRGFGKVDVVALDNAQVEISVAGAGADDLAAIRRMIESQGEVNFLIVANKNDDAELIKRARTSDDEIVTNDDHEQIGRWVRVRTAPNDHVVSPGDTLRAKDDTGAFVVAQWSIQQWDALSDETLAMPELLEQMGWRDPQMLLRLDPNPKMRLDGRHIRFAAASTDYVGNPAVSIQTTVNGGKLLGAITSENQPNSSNSFYRSMAIVLNGKVVSSMKINCVVTQGQIIGNFTMPEVEEIVAFLNAGRLPPILKPEPISVKWVQPP